MYIKYNNMDYPCKCRPSKIMIYRGLPDDFPTPVSGEIILCADDGFILRIDKVEDYLRQNFENGVLTLTNLPELEIIKDIKPNAFDRLEAQIVYTAMMTDTLLEG